MKRSLALLFIIFFLENHLLNGQLKVGGDPHQIHPYALLELESKEKALIQGLNRLSHLYPLLFVLELWVAPLRVSKHTISPPLGCVLFGGHSAGFLLGSAGEKDLQPALENQLLLGVGNSLVHKCEHGRIGQRLQNVLWGG